MYPYSYPYSYPYLQLPPTYSYPYLQLPPTYSYPLPTATPTYSYPLPTATPTYIYPYLQVPPTYIYPCLPIGRQGKMYTHRAGLPICVVSNPCVNARRHAYSTSTERRHAVLIIIMRVVQV